MRSPSAAFTASRFGLGLRPTGSDVFGRDPVAALLDEVEIEARAPAGQALPTSREIFSGVQTHLARVAEMKKASRALVMGETGASPADDGSAGMRPGSGEADDPGMMQAEARAADKPEKPQRPQVDAYNAEFEALIARKHDAPIGFYERLVDFWSNHFAIEKDRNPRVMAIVGAYEREAIRPHVLGRFEDMLLAVAQHPAMLYYLDNYLSAGVHSRAARRRRKLGLNENYGREMLELHTLGADGGYDQSDVRALANALSGWGIVVNPRRPDCGTFAFFASVHEPGPVTIMGKVYAQKGEAQARAVMADLARHPATARHIAFKLAQAFVADDPPKPLVARLAAVFERTGGDLGALAKALVTDPAAWDAPRRKLRTPQEFVWSSIRALPAKYEFRDIRRSLAMLGQTPWSPTSPAGFPGDSRHWLAADAMTNRLDFAQFLAARTHPENPVMLAEATLGDLLTGPTREALMRAESPRQAFALMLMSPEFQRR
ncbi:DUF1800 domain-containing protein [Jiella mangrovi]|uniref:DUF1800 domain-containing protein n=1 Tax=Jiella mangrovi TaxID=2821407 RepID=A0ABS4BFD6_9HYPH|nr:DUF1800 domain-containing protein [Jiella mangrovi]MBP0615421.1 DUF1800 domain-containing protein [Jiella mangrovi]